MPSRHRVKVVTVSVFLRGEFRSSTEATWSLLGISEHAILI